MRTHFLAIAFLLVAALFSCKKEPVPSPNKVVESTSADIKYEECAAFSQAGLTICFTGINEYRCPCDVDCLWAGAVDIKLQVTGNGIDQTISLSYSPGNDNLPNASAAVGGHTIKLTKVLPENCSDYDVASKYVASLNVE